jgi:copper(I)-binding protein
LLRKSRGTTVARRAMFGAIALLVPALAGCEAGQNAPTLDFHPASNGAHAVVSNLSINNVFVLGPSNGTTLPVGSSAGLFLGLYNSGGSTENLVSVSAPGTATSVKLEKGSVSVTPGSSALLTGPQPEVVLTGLTRALSGGQSITVTLDFSNAGPVTLQVPVEPHDFYYGTFSPAPSASTSPTAKASATPKTSGTAKPSSSAKASASPTVSPTK